MRFDLGHPLGHPSSIRNNGDVNTSKRLSSSLAQISGEPHEISDDGLSLGLALGLSLAKALMNLRKSIQNINKAIKLNLGRLVNLSTRIDNLRASFKRNLF